MFDEKTERSREFTIIFLSESDDALDTGSAFENSNSLLGGGDDGERLRGCVYSERQEWADICLKSDAVEG